MRSLSFLTKLTIFAFILSALPVLFIGVFSYITSSDEIQKHVNKGKMQLLMQTNANVEQILRTVNHTLNQVVNSTVLKRAMNEPITVTDFMLYNDLRAEVSHLQSFDTRVEEVVLLNRQQNWMIKNSGVYRLNEYEYQEDLVKLLDIPEDTFWMLNPSHWFYSEESAESVECDNVISLVKKLPTQGLDKYGLALANIPTCSMQEFLQYDEEDASHFMILDENYRILLHPDRSLIGHSIEDTLFLSSDMLSQPSDQIDTMIDHKLHTVSYLRSNLNDWTYVSVISIDSLTQESKKIGVYTSIVCFILLLLSMMLAWMGSRKMYSPIQKLLKQVEERWPEIRKKRNGTNEFQMIGEQVQNLFQSKSELEQEVRRHIQQVSSFFLIKVFEGNAKPSEMSEKFQQFGFASRLEAWNAMAVITLQIDTLDQTRYGKQDMELLLFAVQNMVGELIPAEQRLSPVTIEHTLVTLIGSPDKDSASFSRMIYALTEKLQKEIDNYLGLVVSIGISLPFHTTSEISAAYQEGLEALKQRIKLGEGVIIQYEAVHAGKHFLNLNYPGHIENDLVDAIKLADAEKSKEYLKQFLQAVFELELSPQEYQTPLARLLNNLFIVMQEAGISLNQVQAANRSLFEELFELQIASEIEEWFWDSVILPMIRIFRDRQEAQYQNISEKIIDMIQQYYDTGLTLEECAAKLHYNANYLSSVFRKETNCSFSEYLTAYRFSMAKKWLSETDMPIKDIAAKLRYNNSQNFIRSFRKQEGMTPGQYREKYAKAN